MNKYNEIKFDSETWVWFGIDDDIRDAWDSRFGEKNVDVTLMALREWLKTRPNFEQTIENNYGGNWAIFIWDCLEFIWDCLLNSETIENKV